MSKRASLNEWEIKNQLSIDLSLLFKKKILFKNWAKANEKNCKNWLFSFLISLIIVQQ